MNIVSFVLVFLGAGLGGTLRHSVNQIIPIFFTSLIPFSTLFVNVFGSLLMGILYSYISSRVESSNELRLFLSTGLLGGFTTFSAYSFEIASLYRQEHVALAISYAVGSVILSILGVFFWNYAV